MTFDAWEGGVYCPDDVLMHWGIPGMKHGRRRYQNEDGTWTEQGLAERRKREGFGERRAERKAVKLEKKAAKIERKEKRRAAKAQAKADLAEKRRQSNLKTMTDEELKAKLERAKMEQEYKELKKSPALKLGMDIFNKVLDYNETKRQQELEKNKQIIELKRIDASKVQAVKSAEKAKYDAQAAKSEYKKKKKDVEGGLKTERKKDLLNAKTAYRNTTIWGSIGKRANNRAKYVQEERMNPIEAKKAQRTRELQKLQNAREVQKTNQEYWKSEQERHKARNKK